MTPDLPGSAIGPVRCAVLGSPIAHSLSPTLHRAAYDELGLDWRYDAVEVAEAGLPEFLDALDGRTEATGPAQTWRGLSLTMPLKRAVIGLLDETDDQVERSGAANTVVLEAGQRRGYNTDIPGAAAAITERLGSAPATAVVLGAGATAGSLLLALADLGATSALLLVREPARAAETLDVVSRHPHPLRVEVGRLEDPTPVHADLAVSTIPARAQTRELLGRLHTEAVFEVVYDPWPTPLAAHAAALGLPLVDGLDLLAHQAVGQVELMTGRRVRVETLRAAGRAELDRRHVENA